MPERSPETEAEERIEAARKSGATDLDLSGLRLPLPNGTYRLRIPRDSEATEAQFEISTGVESEVTLR